ncbi:MAG TPA: adenylyltransferase/cytidyltransferase family protein [Candidatus Acidoferrales bacterium]|nr:adenylyltransferase/cytidyltransferase family protein [Candidatus Acidoferrales bacterium]
MDTREKILSRAGLREVLEEPRRASRKIVFAHGVFDLLHAGHVRHLAAARSEGDLLVVGVHSDAAAKKLKGDGRPLLTERARAVLVAALASVDYVVVFDEADVMPIIREFQPDVLAAGSDPTPDDPCGGELAAHGIRVASTGIESTDSTTALIARVRKSRNGN